MSGIYHSSGTQHEDLLLSVVLKHLQITGTEFDVKLNVKYVKQFLRFDDFPIQVDETWSWTLEIAVKRCYKYGH